MGPFLLGAQVFLYFFINFVFKFLKKYFNFFSKFKMFYDFFLKNLKFLH